MLQIELAVPVFIAGIILLYKCSDILVDGASKTAAKLGVSTLIISLLIVAFGTSAPEFAISVGAAFQSHADISMGNIIGSCIANLLLVLGISAIIRPIRIQKSLIKREMPIILGVTLLLLLFSSFNLLDSSHLIGGVIFLLLFIIFIYYFIRCAKNERIAKTSIEKYKSGNSRKNIVYIVVGVIGVVIGAILLIESATTIARFFSISELIIALSMVALGTSLPELAVSAVASYKKESDIAVGNVIGSNIFNIFLILGTCALIIPLNAGASLVHIYFLLGITIILLPILYTGYSISRKEGVILLLLYVVYIWYIFYL